MGAKRQRKEAKPTGALPSLRPSAALSPDEETARLGKRGGACIPAPLLDDGEGERSNKPPGARGVQVGSREGRSDRKAARHARARESKGTQAREEDIPSA